jgi:carbamoyltransferase
MRELLRATDDGGFEVGEIKWSKFARRLRSGDEWGPEHADLASSVQVRLEEVLLDLIRWLHERTGDRDLTMSGGVALNCVATSRLAEQGPFERIWVQPASGDSGTALGAAMYVARSLGDDVRPMPTAALGREWSEEELGDWLRRANVRYERPHDIAEAVAEILAPPQRFTRRLPDRSTHPQVLRSNEPLC